MAARLTDDNDYYVKTFKIFESALSERANWEEDAFSEAVVAKLGVTLAEHEELRILGVGSGSGETDCTMLTKLLQRFPRINNRVVEPADGHLVQYKALAQSKAHELQCVTFDWRQQTIEQYEKAGDLTKFHFISAVHSLYYADDVDSSLMYMYNRLEPGGVLMVTIGSSNNGINSFFDQFSSSSPDRHFFHPYIHSANILSALDRRSIPYTEHRQPINVDITKCFDEASEDGSLLMDFLTHAVNFKEKAPEDLQRRVLEYLASSDHSETKCGGQVLLNDDSEAIVISKPAE